MSDNRIEIPIKKRHTETQEFYRYMHFGKPEDRALIEVLATIADRLTDIADNLEEKDNGK